MERSKPNIAQMTLSLGWQDAKVVWSALSFAIIAGAIIFGGFRLTGLDEGTSYMLVSIVFTVSWAKLMRLRHEEWPDIRGILRELARRLAQSATSTTEPLNARFIAPIVEAITTTAVEKIIWPALEEKFDQREQEIFAQVDCLLGEARLEIRREIEAEIAHELLDEKSEPKLVATAEKQLLDSALRKRTMSMLCRMSRVESEAGTDPRSALFEVARDFTDAFKSYGRYLEISAPDMLPRVKVDSDVFKATVENLLDNALKYSSPGPVRMVASKTDEDTLVVSVVTEAEEIPEDSLPYIFEPVFRRPSHMRGSGPGLGVGLWFARSVAQLADGAVEVELHVEPVRTMKVILTLPVKS